MKTLKETACRANLDLASTGLVVETFGNLSIVDRAAGVFAIKPSGVPYAELTPDKIVIVSLETGGVVDGALRPSSDTPTHLELYRAFSCGAVVHTHSEYATMFAQARTAIGCMGTTHADYFRGDVPVTRPMTESEIADAYEQNTGKVIVETFILFEDKVGFQLKEALIAAARRGAQVDITVDGWGSPDLSTRFIGALTDAGVRVHIFDPGPRPFGWRPQFFRRMHRKVVVVDGQVAFVGGINYSADHLADYGPMAKQDYAIEVRGPIVADIHRDALRTIETVCSEPSRVRPQTRHAGGARVLLSVRDNARHGTDIEEQYLAAIRSATHRLVIANAYFFPGYGFLRDLGASAVDLVPCFGFAGADAVCKVIAHRLGRGGALPSLSRADLGVVGRGLLPERAAVVRAGAIDVLLPQRRIGPAHRLRQWPRRAERVVDGNVA